MLSYTGFWLDGLRSPTHGLQGRRLTETQPSYQGLYPSVRVGDLRFTCAVTASRLYTLPHTPLLSARFTIASPAASSNRPLLPAPSPTPPPLHSSSVSPPTSNLTHTLAAHSAASSRLPHSHVDDLSTTTKPWRFYRFARAASGPGRQSRTLRAQCASMIAASPMPPLQ